MSAIGGKADIGDARALQIAWAGIARGAPAGATRRDIDVDQCSPCGNMAWVPSENKEK
jgi:hypothetical protein